jgi:hypothetical protein
MARRGTASEEEQCAMESTRLRERPTRSTRIDLQQKCHRRSAVWAPVFVDWNAHWVKPRWVTADLRREVLWLKLVREVVAFLCETQGDRGI